MNIDRTVMYKCPSCKGMTMVLAHTYGKLFAFCHCRYVKEIKDEEELKNMIKRLCDIENCNNTIEGTAPNKATFTVNGIVVVETTDDTCNDCIKRIEKAVATAMIKTSRGPARKKSVTTVTH